MMVYKVINYHGGGGHLLSSVNVMANSSEAALSIADKHNLGKRVGSPILRREVSYQMTFDDCLQVSGKPIWKEENEELVNARYYAFEGGTCHLSPR